MGLKSRIKGKVCEREAVHLLRSLGFTDAQRAQQYSGNAGHADIVCPESLPGVFIECKAVKDWSVGCKAIDDALMLAGTQAGDRVPVVLWREHRKGWRLYMFYKDLHVTVSGYGIEPALKWAQATAQEVA